LIEPPRINTTRMIANSSTTDSEMATTDHTLGRSALPARGRHPQRTPARTMVPPTGLPYAGAEASSTPRPDGPARRSGCAAANSRCPHGNSDDAASGNLQQSFPYSHTPFVINSNTSDGPP
jgi:hypothetical protein